MSEASNWMQGIANLDEEYRNKTRSYTEYLDAIVSELSQANGSWWANYSRGYEIATLQYSIDLAISMSCESREINGMRDRILEVKRQIIRDAVIPAMHACIRAGFLKPVER